MDLHSWVTLLRVWGRERGPQGQLRAFNSSLPKRGAALSWGGEPLKTHNRKTLEKKGLRGDGAKEPVDISGWSGKQVWPVNFKPWRSALTPICIMTLVNWWIGNSDYDFVSIHLHLLRALQISSVLTFKNVNVWCMLYSCWFLMCIACYIVIQWYLLFSPICLTSTSSQFLIFS